MQHLPIISFLLFFLVACQAARPEDTAVPTLPVQETTTIVAEEPPATSSSPPSSTAAPDPAETAPDLGEEELVPVSITGLGDPIYPDLGNEGIDVQHYDLDLVVDMKAGTISGSTKIDAVATESRTWFSLDLAGLEVEAVDVNGDPASFSVEASKLIILPGLELSQDEPFTAVIQYAGKPQPIPDRSAPIDLGWQTRSSGTFVVSEPSGAMNWFPNNNHPSDKATYTMRFTLPQPYGLASNGVLTESEQVGANNVFTWEMEQPMASYLAIAQINQYEVEEEETDSGVAIRNYFPLDTPDRVRDAFDQTAEMIAFMEETIAPYPFDSYGVVLLGQPAGWALETQSLSTYGADGPSRPGVVVHELSHQWFGDNVSVASWQDIWLNEGFATYFEQLWLEYSEHADIEANMSDLYAEIADRNLSSPIPTEAQDLFGSPVYLRGAYTLHALRQTVGDDIFFQILREYYDRHQGDSASTTDFIAVAEELGGQTAVDILNKWLYSDTIPAQN